MENNRNVKKFGINPDDLIINKLLYSKNMLSLELKILATEEMRNIAKKLMGEARQDMKESLKIIVQNNHDVFYSQVGIAKILQEIDKMI